MIIKTHEKYILRIFSKNILLVTGVFLVLIFFLNILEEIRFFESYESEIQIGLPLFLTFLNSPSLVFETFPFIFLISTQLLFVNLYDNQEISIFKTYGIKNLNLIKILLVSSIIFGIIISTIFYTASSSLKNIYLTLKNNYTSDNKYLAVVNENGLWIKDSIDNKINIINAENYSNYNLKKISITVLDQDFNLIQTIISDKALIKEENWTLVNAQIFSEKQINEYHENYIFRTNFDFQKISSLFSNLTAFNLFELRELFEDYKSFGYSTLEIESHLNKLYSLPIYVSIMTVLGSIFMLNIKYNKSKIFSIISGTIISVLIYYLNYFSNVMGTSEKLPIFASTWFPYVLLTLICLTGMIKINEK
tara:strand:- start:403 stop:1491 length:1089 start_codon:yes stop_codon:yes gene_type:complete